MNAVTSSPVSIGQVLDAGFKLYRRSFTALVPLTLIGALISIAPTLAFGVRTTLTGLSAGYFVGVLISAVVGTAVLGAAIARLDDIASGRNALNLGSSFGRGFSKVLPLLGAAIIYGFVVAVGTLLLVVPGVWLSVALAFAFYAVMLDDAGVTESFDVSRKLVAGNWWRVLVILSVGFAILFALVGGVGLLAGLFAVSGRVAEQATGVAGPSTALLLGFQVLNGLVSAVVSPLLYAIGYAAYRDLQLRKSGGDLAARIAASA